MLPLDPPSSYGLRALLFSMVPSPFLLIGLMPCPLSLAADHSLMILQEAGMMASLRHPNVVMYLGVCMEPPCVITEYCARGSLNDVLKRARYVPALAMQLDWPRRLNMCLDAAKGMMYLHSSEPPIIHRDLKSPNLLVDKHWRVKVLAPLSVRITPPPLPPPPPFFLQDPSKLQLIMSCTLHLTWEPSDASLQSTVYCHARHPPFQICTAPPGPLPPPPQRIHTT